MNMIEKIANGDHATRSNPSGKLKIADLDKIAEYLRTTSVSPTLVQDEIGSTWEITVPIADLKPWVPFIPVSKSQRETIADAIELLEECRNSVIAFRINTARNNEVEIFGSGNPG